MNPKHLALLLAFGTSIVPTVAQTTVFTPTGTVAASANSNVGIGTNAPASQLHVYSTSNTELTIEGSDTGYHQGALVLKGANNASRANGTYVFNQPGGYEWFAGVPYGLGDTFVINRKGGVISHDTSVAHVTNALLMIRNDGNVGIGTTVPDQKLSVVGSIKLGDASDYRGHSLVQNYMSLGETESAATTILGNNVKVVNGTNSRLQVSSSGGDGSNWLGINYYNGFTFNHIAAASVGTEFHENSGELMRIAINGNVGIGTTTPSHKLAVNGAIRAKEVIVDTGWADYVFADDYELKPLAEVEAHIREKKHLPGIPSAQEVAEQGVSIGEMQAKLLAKIEELTLHVIAQEKRMKRIEKENELLRSLVQPPVNR